MKKIERFLVGLFSWITNFNGETVTYNDEFSNDRVRMSIIYEYGVISYIVIIDDNDKREVTITPGRRNGIEIEEDLLHN